MVVFERCEALKGKKECKSNQEIEDWMLERYIVVLVNEKKIMTYLFEDESIQKKSNFYLYALNYKSRSNYVNKIVQSHFEMHDSLLHIDDMLLHEENGFTV